TPRFKLVKRYPDGPDELFDLQTDPREQNNRAGSPELATVEAELRKRLETWYARHEDPAKSGLRVRELRQHNLRSEAGGAGGRAGRNTARARIGRRSGRCSARWTRGSRSSIPRPATDWGMRRKSSARRSATGAGRRWSSRRAGSCGRRRRTASGATAAAPTS